MMTRLPCQNRSKWVCSTAVALLFAVNAGCAHERTQPVQPLGPSDHTVRIVFDASNCPVSVQLQEPPCDPRKPQCLRVHNNETVLFQAWSGDHAISRAFELQFDPFKRAPLNAGSGQLQLRVDLEYGHAKEFPYNVLSGTCKPLDPEIVVN